METLEQFYQSKILDIVTKSWFKRPAPAGSYSMSDYKGLRVFKNTDRENTFYLMHPFEDVVLGLETVGLDGNGQIRSFVPGRYDPFHAKEVDKMYSLLRGYTLDLCKKVVMPRGWELLYKEPKPEEVPSTGPYR